jgi:hypothetical protein
VSVDWFEPFLIRTNDGPTPGTRLIHDGNFDYSWPLPDELPAPGGRYVKVGESQLAPQHEGSHVIRGAEYEWQEESSDG